jgi:hypothetical protein
MAEEFTSVNADQTGVEGQQAVQNTSVDAGTGITTQVQSPQENAAFADMRRRLEATESKTSKLEKDYTISKKYGAEYGVYSEEDIAEKYVSYGITTLEQLEAAIEEEKQRKQNPGFDPKAVEQLIQKQLSGNPVIKQTQEYFNQARIAQEKVALQGKKFFKELEADIDKVIKVNPNLAVTDVYNYLKGIKADELYENAAKTAAGQAVEDQINQSKRSTETFTAPPGETVTLDFTATEKDWAERRVKQGTYKNLQEAWSYLRGKSGVKMR